MKSVTLLFPSAKARLRGPLQPKPSFQPASSSEKANTSHHTEQGPVFPETFTAAGQGWWEALPAGAALPGRARAHSPASAKCPLGSSSHCHCQKCRGKAQNGANEGQRGKRHNLIKKKGIPHTLLLQLCKVSLYKSRDAEAHQLFPHSRLLKTGLSHKAKQTLAGLQALHRPHLLQAEDLPTLGLNVVQN